MKENNNSRTKSIIILVIVGVVILLMTSLVMKFLVKKVSTTLLQGAIENKTGVKTDLKDIEKGKATFTDTKTGQTVTIEGDKLPDTFPKDFPIYQGTKVISSVSGTQQDKSNGLLVVFTTTDGLDKVVPFYKSELGTNGWTITSSFDSDTVQTWVITKGTTEGSVSITSQEGQTTIQVMLGNQQPPS